MTDQIIPGADGAAAHAMTEAAVDPVAGLAANGTAHTDGAEPTTAAGDDHVVHQLPRPPGHSFT